MSASIKIEGVQKALQRLARLEDGKPIMAAIRAAALHVKGKLAVYPAKKKITRASVYGTAFKSLKQRRWFFAALKNGTIDVPYKRGQSNGSEAFGRRWTIATKDNGFTATVGNNASYGVYLMAAGKQNAYARAMGWKTEETVLNEERDYIIGKVQEEINKAIEG